MNDPRLHRGAEHLHTLGPRAVAEFLAEIGQQHDCIDAWRRLNAADVRLVGGDRMPVRLRLVPRDLGRDGA